MRLRRFLLGLLLLALVSCSAIPTPVLRSPSVTSESTLPTAWTNITGAPDAQRPARAYLDAWKAEDYATMYGLLTSISQAAISKDEFVKHYKSVANEAALSGLDYKMLAAAVINSELAQVNYRVTLHSILVGDIERDTVMNLGLEKGQWRVQWDDTLVLPDLKGGNYLGMDRQGYIPSRANIYDRNGHALVGQNDAVAIGLLPDQIVPDQMPGLFKNISSLCGIRADSIEGLYAQFPPGANWYLPLCEVPSDKIASRYQSISGYGGLVLKPYKARYYLDGGIAPHLVGYVSAIQADEVDDYKRKGYQPDERVGRTGLEAWGEQYLSGQRGGALYVFNTQGQRVTRLAERAPEPSQAITTTIDKDLQEGAQQAVKGFRGAVVVLERDTGRVLAMVSSPAFDPNSFEPVNYNSGSQLASLTNDESQPLYNRASLGQYPLGSVFKIITMSAALESGKYTSETTYQCGYFFDEIPGVRLHDWTYEFFLNDGKTIPSGLLTLSQGLMRSCDPFFFHIGLDLYNKGLTKTISDMARAFGLGSKTGITGVGEAAGRIPDPGTEIDATNLAIGQGDTMVTPLQVADFVAAVGNGGTLYRPQVIEKIAPPGGTPTYTFKPEVRGKLPVSPATLEAVQQAMVGVVTSSQPRGTAFHVFTGINVNVAGKTGTAQSGSGEPHAWFAGYTFANRPNKPDIAIAVICENAGEGSDYAAPVFRRIVELYFNGSPGKLYWWESTYNVTQTPTSQYTPAPAKATPTP